MIEVIITNVFFSLVFFLILFDCSHGSHGSHDSHGSHGSRDPHGSHDSHDLRDSLAR